MRIDILLEKIVMKKRKSERLLAYPCQLHKIKYCIESFRSCKIIPSNSTTMSLWKNNFRLCAFLQGTYLKNHNFAMLMAETKLTLSTSQIIVSSFNVQ